MVHRTLQDGLKEKTKTRAERTEVWTEIWCTMRSSDVIIYESILQDVLGVSCVG
jgi:hypothetical protein